MSAPNIRNLSPVQLEEAIKSTSAALNETAAAWQFSVASGCLFPELQVPADLAKSNQSDLNDTPGLERTVVRLRAELGKYISARQIATRRYLVPFSFLGRCD